MVDLSLLSPGDTVVLASGGPDMAVSQVDEARGLVCCWWVRGDGTTDEGLFLAECLWPA
jgi:uncharacterized protein YodC (DUF2158 family)